MFRDPLIAHLSEIGALIAARPCADERDAGGDDTETQDHPHGIHDDVPFAAPALSGAAPEHRDEEKLRERIGSRKQLAGPVVPDLQRRHAFVGEHEVQAVLPRRKAVGRREPIMASARRGVHRPGDREADAGRVRLPDDEPAIGGSVGKGDVARAVARKRAAECFDVTLHRRPELLDQTTAMNANEIRLSSGDLFLLLTHRVACPLVVHDPLDPVGNQDISSHYSSALQTAGDGTP